MAAEVGGEEGDGVGGGTSMRRIALQAPMREGVVSVMCGVWGVMMPMAGAEAVNVMILGVLHIGRAGAAGGEGGSMTQMALPRSCRGGAAGNGGALTARVTEVMMCLRIANIMCTAAAAVCRDAGAMSKTRPAGVEMWRWRVSMARVAVAAMCIEDTRVGEAGAVLTMRTEKMEIGRTGLPLLVRSTVVAAEAPGPGRGSARAGEAGTVDMSRRVVALHTGATVSVGAGTAHFRSIATGSMWTAAQMVRCSALGAGIMPMATVNMMTGRQGTRMPVPGVTMYVMAGGTTRATRGGPDTGRVGTEKCGHLGGAPHGMRRRLVATGATITIPLTGGSHGTRKLVATGATIVGPPAGGPRGMMGTLLVAAGVAHSAKIPPLTGGPHGMTMLVATGVAHTARMLLWGGVPSRLVAETLMGGDGKRPTCMIPVSSKRDDHRGGPRCNTQIPD